MSAATAALHKSPSIAVEPKVAISADEQQRRASYVASANGHSAMEGHFGTPLLDELQSRYISGELTTQECIAEAKREYGLR